MTLLDQVRAEARLLKIAPAQIPGKGCGVVAVAPIAAGEVIDEACTLHLNDAQCAAIEATPAGDHYFMHPEDETGGLLVLGLPSLCNHAEDHNADTAYRRDEALGWVVVLTARRDIRTGEEVTRHYACPPWFELGA